jgi:hypothetical protein
MSKRRKKRKPSKAKANERRSASRESGIWQLYRRACELATEGQHVDAGRLYEKAGQGVTDNRLQALIQNDFAVLAVVAYAKSLPLFKLEMVHIIAQ